MKLKKLKNKNFYIWIIIAILAVIIIFRAFLFFNDAKTDDAIRKEYDQISGLIAGEKCEEAEKLLSKSGYSKISYTDENGYYKMKLYRSLYIKEKKYDEAANIIVAYLKDNNIDVNSEQTDSSVAMNLDDIVWTTSDIYDELSEPKKKEVMDLMGKKLEDDINYEDRELREANLAKNYEFLKVQYYIENESVEEAKKVLDESSFSKMDYKESTDDTKIIGGIFKMRLYKDLYIKQEKYDEAEDVMMDFIKVNSDTHKFDQSVSTFVAQIYDNLSEEKKKEVTEVLGDALTTELNRKKE